MKKTLFLLFAVIAIMTSCSKEEEPEIYSDIETPKLLVSTTWKCNDELLIFRENGTDFSVYNIRDLDTKIGSGCVNFIITDGVKSNTTSYVLTGASGPGTRDVISSTDNYQTNIMCLGRGWTKQ